MILPVMKEHLECAGLQELHAWAIDCVLSHWGDGGGGGHSALCDCETCCIGRQGSVVALVEAMGRHERVRASPGICPKCAFGLIRLCI